MLYDFKCTECGHEQSAVFPANDYDKYVMEDGRLKRRKCENCRAIKLYRHITRAPAALGGTNGYVSMDRWLKQNPDHSKRKEAELEKKMGDRHRKRVLDKINKDMKRSGRDERNKGYGDGQGESNLGSVSDD